MPFSLQMSKPRFRRLTSVSKDSNRVVPEPGPKCQTLTTPPTFQKQALCCPLSVGNVNNDFQDRAGRGQPLTCSVKRLSAESQPSHSVHSQAARPLCLLISIWEEDRVTAPESPSEVSPWGQVTGSWLPDLRCHSGQQWSSWARG